MEKSTNAENTFEAVWERVSQNTSSAPSDESDNVLLSNIISAELDNRAFYSTVAKRSSSNCSELFRRLATASSARLQRLQTLYFIILGNTCPAKPQYTSHKLSTISALRSAYWRERDTASRLISAAGTIGSGKFSSCAAYFAHQAADNAERIMQLIDKLMV